MRRNRRYDLVNEIFDHAILIGSNKSRVLLVLAFMSDKELTKFHKKYLQLKTDNVQPTIDSDAKK